MGLLGIDIDKDALKTAYEKHTSNQVALGESAGILPDISTLNCSTIEKAISDAERLSEMWRPTPELLQAYTDWMAQARSKLAQCKAADAPIAPVPKKRISKNLTPIVLIAGAVVAGIIASKILSNDK